MNSRGVGPGRIFQHLGRASRRSHKRKKHLTASEFSHKLAQKGGLSGTSISPKDKDIRRIVQKGAQLREYFILSFGEYDGVFHLYIN